MYSHKIKIRNLEIGGDAPARIQSMITASPLDAQETIAQCLKLFHYGSELIRIATPSLKAAQALEVVAFKLRALGVVTPLVADVHFLQEAAFEAIKHVDKVRINPGNFAEKSKGKNSILDEESVVRFFERAKVLNKAVRIGVNHGSLSKRMLEKFGNTPEGMVESALEYIKIAEGVGFDQLVISAKASDVKIMILANQLLVKRMQADCNHLYPIHLGVTEAGEGIEGRIKSAIGIGSLLLDGIGDTIRVSLTEDPINEIESAKRLIWIVEREKLLARTFSKQESDDRSVGLLAKSKPSTKVYLEVPHWDRQKKELINTIFSNEEKQKNEPIEGLILYYQEGYYGKLKELLRELPSLDVFLDFEEQALPKEKLSVPSNSKISFVKTFHTFDKKVWDAWLGFAIENKAKLAVELVHIQESDYRDLRTWLGENAQYVICCMATDRTHSFNIDFANWIVENKLKVWIRHRPIKANEKQEDQILHFALQTGRWFCNGIGDILSVSEKGNPSNILSQAYCVLQTCGIRSSSAEFISCPGCGRTKFNLEATAKIVKQRLKHLKGLKIAVMGCIVNGPGEMADADYGYIGGGDGKVNLYRGKECVRFGINEDVAVDALINLIKSDGKWQDPV